MGIARFLTRGKSDHSENARKADKTFHLHAPHIKVAREIICEAC
jgi:hypothetical protein